MTSAGHLAAATGRSKTFCIVEAVREHLEDLEDNHLADQAWVEHQGSGEPLASMVEVLDELGVTALELGR